MPTDRAYRLYIDELMRQRKVADDVREQVDSDLDSGRRRRQPLSSPPPRACSRSSRARSASSWRPTRCTPSSKSLRFLAVAPGKILVVQVNEPDVVISRVLETDVDYTPAELDALSERLTREYGGLTLHEVRRRLLAAHGARARRGGPDPRPRRRRWRAGRFEKNDAEEQPVLRRNGPPAGEARVLRRVSLKRIFQAFDEKARVLDLVSRYLDSRGTSVVLGSEDDHAVDPRLSAVLTSYGTGETLTGMLGVIGPARREYTRRDPRRGAAGPGRLRPPRPARGLRAEADGRE